MIKKRDSLQQMTAAMGYLVLSITFFIAVATMTTYMHYQQNRLYQELQTAIKTQQSLTIANDQLTLTLGELDKQATIQKRAKQLGMHLPGKKELKLTDLDHDRD